MKRAMIQTRLETTDMAGCHSGSPDSLTPATWLDVKDGWQPGDMVFIVRVDRMLPLLDAARHHARSCCLVDGAIARASHRCALCAAVAAIDGIADSNPDRGKDDERHDRKRHVPGL